MSFEALKLHVGHRSMVFTYRSVVECFNCKWPLYSVTADCVRENCLCRCGTEERQTKQSEMPQLTAYHWRTPKVSGRREIYCWCCFCSVRSVSPLSNIYGLVLVKCRPNVANKLFISRVFNPIHSYTCNKLTALLNALICPKEVEASSFSLWRYRILQ